MHQRIYPRKRCNATQTKQVTSKHANYLGGVALFALDKPFDEAGPVVIGRVTAAIGQCSFHVTAARKHYRFWVNVNGYALTKE